MSHLERIAEFLRKRVSPDAPTKVAYFSLTHQGKTGTSEIVNKYVVRAIRPDDDIGRENLVLETAQAIEQEAEAHHEACQFHGKERYSLFAHTKGDKPFNQIALSIGPDRDMAQALVLESLESSDPATLAGSHAMVMRMHDQSAKAHFLGLHQNNQVLRQENESLRSRISELEETHIKIIRTYSELMDRKVEREMELDEKRFNKERNARLFDKAEAFLPVVMQAITGYNPNSTLGMLLKSLSSEQFTAILTSLSSEQRGLLKMVIAELPQEKNNGVAS